jgi:LPXTG-site transpeptidase (sortase) family protein
MAGREDIAQSVRFSPDGGYDGQFFYFMTFDPFLTAFRHEPQRYGEYIDFPPYRYGRIGFSLLTKVFSGDRPAWYPATMVALVCFWVVAQMLWFGGISENRDQQLLYSRFRTELAAATAPVGPVTPVGAPVALLTIPHLGVQQVVVEGTASGDLLAGPGHLRNTVLPGQAGTSVVFGRASTYGAPFRNIDRLRRGDRLAVATPYGTFRYAVEGTRIVDPADLRVLRTVGHSRLVLTACHPLFSAARRIVVYAAQIGIGRTAKGLKRGVDESR